VTNVGNMPVKTTDCATTTPTTSTVTFTTATSTSTTSTSTTSKVTFTTATSTSTTSTVTFTTATTTSTPTTTPETSIDLATNDNNGGDTEGTSVVKNQGDTGTDKPNTTDDSSTPPPSLNSNVTNPTNTTTDPTNGSVLNPTTFTTTTTLKPADSATDESSGPSEAMIGGIIIGTLLLLVVLGVVGWKWQAMQSEKTQLLDRTAYTRGVGDLVLTTNTAYDLGVVGDPDGAEDYPYAEPDQPPAIYAEAVLDGKAAAYVEPNSLQPAVYDQAKEDASTYLEPSAVQNDLYTSGEAAGLYHRTVGVDPNDVGEYGQLGNVGAVFGSATSGSGVAGGGVAGGATGGAVARCPYRQAVSEGGAQCKIRTNLAPSSGYCLAKHACTAPGCTNSKSSKQKRCTEYSHGSGAGKGGKGGKGIGPRQGSVYHGFEQGDDEDGSSA
jgi:hypothetical protein